MFLGIQRIGERERDLGAQKPEADALVFHGGSPGSSLWDAQLSGKEKALVTWS